MRKGLRTFCNDDVSTSTVNQRQMNNKCSSSSSSSSLLLLPSNKYDDTKRLSESIARRRASPSPSRGMTLEDMILKLEMEEKKSSSSGVISARDALNQYPRFSLDGKDAMYRSSFRNTNNNSRLGMGMGRRSVCCDYRVVQRMGIPTTTRTTMFAGERVVWCKPGVVAKLMGLEALPMPLRKLRSSTNSNSINHLLLPNNTQNRFL